jgi:hypothetical protein
VSPGVATRKAGDRHTVGVRLKTQKGQTRTGRDITVEVYRKAPAAPLPSGHTTGTPYQLAEQSFTKTDKTGRTSFGYTSTVAGDDVIVACAGYQNSCVQNDAKVLVVTAQGPANLRTDYVHGGAAARSTRSSGTTSW